MAKPLPDMEGLWGRQARLRPLRIGDVEMIRQWRNQGSVRKWFFDTDQITKEEQGQWADRYFADPADQLFVIESAAEFGAPVGLIGLSRLDADYPELGRMLIAEQYQRAGCGTDAVRTLAYWARDTLRKRGLVLFVRQDNVVAQMIYLRNGFLIQSLDGGIVCMRRTFADAAL